jgi:hypothetical protein
MEYHVHYEIQNDISRKIGQYKKEHNIAILQTSRWDTVLSAMVGKGKGIQSI